MTLRRAILALVTVCSCTATTFAAPLAIGVFHVDASPPVGSPLAYDINQEVLIPLDCSGVVLVGDEAPIVLCAVDWLGVANDGYDEFRASLAEAAGTTSDRVALHSLHQHDAPRCDFTAHELLAAFGISQQCFDEEFSRDVMRRAAAAVRTAVRDAQPITHLGVSQGTVEKVASNRRILGSDGKVRVTRWTATADPEIRAEPVGTVDASLKMLTFWQEDTPLVALTYYATHPQSYYRTGQANPDFPGIARNLRQSETGVPHVHFNGAGGNIGAGKWNDGSQENRMVLANRVAAGMRIAWETTDRVPLTAEDVGWKSLAVSLPVAGHLFEEELETALADENSSVMERASAASHLAWLRRCQAGNTIDVSCLGLGNVRVLHLPGELFVEYQLTAQALRPDLFVAMAAYGDYGPGYIGTEIAYTQGGYETSPGASRVAPEVESVLMDAIEQLLSRKPVPEAQD